MKKKILLFFILAAAVFLRVFLLKDFLGFYYDQGRDALVVWRLIHEGKFFLIGPVTGIEGIFLGPFYYYLIAFFYFLGRGSPVFVASALGVLSVLGIWWLYLVGARVFGQKAGLLAALIGAFSYSLVVFSRWLSNPNPLPLFSLLTVWGLLKIYQGEEKFWLWAALFAGLSLQFEAAAAIFFLPAIFIFAIWQKAKTRKKRFLLAGLVVFLATLLPQFIFKLRHQGVLFAGFQKFLLAESSYNLPLSQLIRTRLETYFDIFFSLLFYGHKNIGLFFLAVFIFLVWQFRKKLFSPEVKILLLWSFFPLFFLLFYRGNYGYIWGYYFAGVWPIFLLLVAFLLCQAWEKLWGKLFVASFLVAFFWLNLTQLQVYYKIGIGIVLKDQLAAIDWIYQDTEGKDFNVDVYVPPVIPYAYDYLFKWYGEKQHHRQPLVENVPLLYTLSEADPPHPERLDAWLMRQKTIALPEKSQQFGEITVERRWRLK